MFALPRRISLLFTVSLTLASLTTVWLAARSVVSATDDLPPSPLALPNSAAQSSASLHNAGFDNHDWYFFGVDRYDPSYPSGPDGRKPILPDDDNNDPDHIPFSELQDWRLWYMRNTPLIQTFAEATVKQGGAESVAVRTYSGDIHLGGLYQMIYDTTPCRLYNFQMYVTSKPDTGAPAATLRVGIEQTGWRPDPFTDPAVPGAFPATTVWGAAQDYKYPTFGLVSVTAEARDSQIAAYTYANTTGGRRHAIVWDSGSLADVTPAMIHDPDNLPAPGGVSNVVASPGTTSASISWNTDNSAIGQVYYRLVPPGGSAIPGYTNEIYLPIIIGGVPVEWVATALEQTASTSHTATLADLLSDQTYEYRVVSRGVSGGACTTWVSELKTFKTAPFQAQDETP